jgi:hypothetical protein
MGESGSLMLDAMLWVMLIGSGIPSAIDPKLGSSICIEGLIESAGRLFAFCLTR